MHRYLVNRLFYLSMCAMLAIATDGMATDVPATPVPQSEVATQAMPSMPSATGFDRLFQRLDLGDLSALDSAGQRKIVTQLQGLLPPGDAHRGRLLDSLHCELDFTNAATAGFAFADKNLAAALKAGDSDAAIRFYYCRGGYQETINSTRDALADFERGLDLARTSGDVGMLASGLQLRGGVYSLLGIYGKALADLLEAQRLFQQNELAEAASQNLLSIGIAYRRLGLPDKAREYLNQSVAHAQQVGDRESLFVSTLQLGYADEEAEHYSTALKTYRAALNLATPSGDRSSIGSANMAIASALIGLHDYPQALASLQTAQADFVAAGDTADEGMLQFHRGRAMAGLGQQRQALTAFDRAGTALDISGNQRYLELLHQAKAQSLEATGKAEAALAEYKRYLAAHEAVTQQRTDQQAQMLRGQFDADRNDLENARLKAEQTLQDRQVRSLQTVRFWQQVTMALLVVLLGVLALLTVRQLGRLRRWKQIASLDPLTGVANRRALDHFSADAMRRARTHGESLAVLALDVDRFKTINDRFGHAIGDRTLKHIARVCQESLRDNDLLGRIGGEEFLAVLPGNSLQHAAEVAERLRRRVETLAPPDLPAKLRVTVSIGFATLSPQDGSFADLERRADMALYQAKAAGRNRSVHATDSNAQVLGAGAAAATAGADAAVAAATGDSAAL